jgi:hypothetical protein
VLAREGVTGVESSTMPSWTAVAISQFTASPLCISVVTAPPRLTDTSPTASRSALAHSPKTMGQRERRHELSFLRGS